MIVMFLFLFFAGFAGLFLWTIHKDEERDIVALGKVALICLYAVGGLILLTAFGL